MTTTAGPNRNDQSVTEIYSEAQRYFMGEGAINNTLSQLAADLKSRHIDYVVIGAVAMLAHGYPRFTEDIDLVLTAEGLERFHAELIGLGYAPAFAGARKRLRSTAGNVRIDVMTTGDYPGDGRAKPVTMPEPNEAAIEIDGIKFVTLEKLIELKLASGMTAPHRLKDLADVQELIKLRELSDNFVQRLDPYVREKFLELLEAVRSNRNDER